MNKDEHFDIRTQKLIKQSEAGIYLLNLRNGKGYSLAKVAKTLEISANYLSEIERGLKVPSDTLLIELASYYNIDADTLYNLYGKVPFSIINELEKNEELRSTLFEIVSNQTLTEEQRNELYKTFHCCYERLLSEIEHVYSDLEDI